MEATRRQEERIEFSGTSEEVFPWSRGETIGCGCQREQMRMWLAIWGLLASLFKAILRCCGEGKIESEETGSSNARRQRRVIGKGSRRVTMRQKSLSGQGGCPGKKI